MLAVICCAVVVNGWPLNKDYYRPTTRLDAVVSNSLLMNVPVKQLCLELVILHGIGMMIHLFISSTGMIIFSHDLCHFIFCQPLRNQYRAFESLKSSRCTVDTGQCNTVFFGSCRFFLFVVQLSPKLHYNYNSDQ